MNPMPMDDEDEDMAAISSVMAADAPPPADAEAAPAADPSTLLADLKTKIAELEASLKML